MALSWQAKNPIPAFFLINLLLKKLRGLHLMPGLSTPGWDLISEFLSTRLGKPLMRYASELFHVMRGADFVELLENL